MQPAATDQPAAPVREALIESVPVLIGRLDAQGIVQQTEGSLPNADILGGIEPGQTDLLAVFPDDAEEIRATLKSGGTRIHIRTGDDEHPAHFELRTIFDHKRGSGAYFSIYDITETRLLQLALLDCTDHEQMRVGQELHDTLGQQLTGIAYQLHALQERLPSNAADRVWKIQERVADCLSQARNIAFNLSPQFAGEDIHGAFERLGTHLRETFDIECRFTAKLDRPITNSGVAFHLFRIAQEACTNAMRHASPSRIEIRLTTGSSNILEVINDGHAIVAPDKPDLPGMGLAMMKFRAHAMGGSLRLQPREGGGTIVRCRFENNATACSAPPSEDQPCSTCL